MATKAHSIAIAIGRLAEAAIAGKLSEEEHEAKNSALWELAADLGLRSEVDRIITNAAYDEMEAARRKLVKSSSLKW